MEIIKAENLINKPLYFHIQNLSQTVSGYGKNLKTTWMMKYKKRLHRIYYCCFSNIGTYYIKSGGKEIVVELN
jgi:hypothetical protein